ncbi:MAG: hypothetical protein ABI729_07650 [Chitinophagales bacterium]
MKILLLLFLPNQFNFCLLIFSLSSSFSFASANVVLIGKNFAHSNQEVPNNISAFFRTDEAINSASINYEGMDMQVG